MFRPLGILIGQQPPHMEEAWNLTIYYSEIVGPSTVELTPGSIVTLSCPVSAKDILV